VALSARGAQRRARDAGAPAAPLREVVRFEQTDDGQRLALAELCGPDAPRAPAAPAFLLLHGFAQNRRSFTLGPLPGALLARGARVFAGELRGHGESRVASRRAWSLRTHLELDCPALIAGVRREAGAERVHLVGHSMGGLLGCALLAGGSPLASLTAMATPILLGAGRPLVRLASLLAGPFATIAPKHHRVPIDRLLARLARPLSRADARGPARWLQRAMRLANPAGAPPDLLRAVLASADAESPAVFEELARNALLARARVAGVDLVRALAASPLPVAAVVGSADLFAPREAVAPLEAPGQAGPRLVLEIPGATHVDAAIGHHVPDTVGRLWDFLVPPARVASGPEPASASRR